MFADADLAAVASLMTTQRAPLLLALLGGKPLSASELAERSGISRSLASSHLTKLREGGLVSVRTHGRARHYSLAGDEVAQAIESLLRIAPQAPATGLRGVNRGEAIRRARTCYDHLAGELGVGITESLVRARLIEPAASGFVPTARGERRLAAFDIDVDELRTERRAFARPCMDWTERRPHLAGALGAGLADRLLERGWVRRLPTSRAVAITDLGVTGLRAELGVNLPD